MANSCVRAARGDDVGRERFAVLCRKLLMVFQRDVRCVWSPKSSLHDKENRIGAETVYQTTKWFNGSSRPRSAFNLGSRKPRVETASSRFNFTSRLIH